VYFTDWRIAFDGWLDAFGTARNAGLQIFLDVNVSAFGN